MLVLSSTGGRLGNQLIVHAHVLAFTLEHGLSAYFPTFYTYRDSFEGSKRGLVVGNELIRSLERPMPKALLAWLFLKGGNFCANQKIRSTIVGTAFASYDEPIVNTELDEPQFLDLVRRHKLLFMLGFRFRAAECVVRQFDSIQQYFRPVAAIRSQIDKVENAARALGEVVVGVHVRQGDYATFQGGRYFHSLDVYAQKMHQIRKMLEPRSVVFLVLSEEPLSGAAFVGLKLVSGPGSPVADMYSISRCDYSFGVPSTFSRWGAFYGQVPHWIMHSADEQPDLSLFTVHRSC